MNYKILLTIVLLAVALTGCARDGHQVAHEDPALFEKAKDPQIKAQTYFAAGQLAEERQEFYKAEFQYKKALQLDPSHQGALFRTGYMLAQQRRYAEAITIWQRYVKATGGSADAFSDLAYCEELAGNPTAAEADYRKGVAQDPKNESCRVNFGLMLARHGRINEGILQLQTVLTPAEVHYNLAGIYELDHRKEQARIEYQAALGLDPNMDEAKAKLAQLN